MEESFAQWLETQPQEVRDSLSVPKKKRKLTKEQVRLKSARHYANRRARQIEHLKTLPLDTRSKLSVIAHLELEREGKNG